jgi:hypothetical protein
MKIFHCDHCQQLVFYENIRCESCGHALAYLPDLAVIGSLEQAGENLWRSPTVTISAYASSHPWEDSAETWAHYLHMTDTLETATGCGLSLQPRRSDEPALNANFVLRGCRPESFDQMIESWFPLAYVLNNLNRGLGLRDAYPFILSTPAIEKLRFVHEVVGAAAP